MKPIFITVAGDLDLRVIPDSLAHVDGHPVITYSYTIYNDRNSIERLEFEKEAKLHLEKKDDPDYRGEIVFEKPGKLFNYIADDDNRLSPFEIQELVEKLSEYRDNPSHWSFPEGS